jgi:hypothetical protein
MALLCAQDASADLQRLEGIEAEWFELCSNCKKNLELSKENDAASNDSDVAPARRADRCDRLNEWFQDELLKTRIALQEIGVEADTILQRQEILDDAGGPSAANSPGYFDVETKALLQRLRAATERTFALSHAPLALSAVAAVNSLDVFDSARFFKSLMTSPAMGPAAIDGLMTMFFAKPCVLTSATDWLFSATHEYRMDVLPHLVHRLPPSSVKEAFFKFVDTEWHQVLTPRQTIEAYHALSLGFDLQRGSADWQLLHARVIQKLSNRAKFSKANALFALFAYQRGILDAKMPCFDSDFVFLFPSLKGCDDDMFMDVLRLFVDRYNDFSGFLHVVYSESPAKKKQRIYIDLLKEAAERRHVAFLDVLLRSFQLFGDTSDANAILSHYEALIQTACLNNMFSKAASPATKETLLRITSHPAAVYAFFSNDTLTDAVRCGQTYVVRVLLQDPAIVPSTFVVTSASEKQNFGMMELLLSDPRVIPAVKRFQRDTRGVEEFRDMFRDRLFDDDMKTEKQALDGTRLAENEDSFPTREDVRSIHVARHAARKRMQKRGKWNQDPASAWFQANRARLDGFVAEIVAFQEEARALALDA